MAENPAETPADPVRTDVQTDLASAAPIEVTVRYFAAARAAAGVESETVRVRAGTTIAELVEELAGRGTRLEAVLRRCSYLRDGIAVRDDTAALLTGNTVDVLPPFAGG